MAASTPAGGAQVGSASWVSEHFVRLFYSVLARHPGHLSKFYKEHSSLCVSLSSAAGSPPAFAHGDLQAVQDIVNSTIAFAQCSPDFTDSVFSIDGGVVIQCVGRISGLQGQSRERPYVQTFFLARQEHGYYVLNDILRLLPEQPPYTSSPVASTLPPTLAHPTAQEVPPYMPNQKILQDLQANQPRVPAMNGPPTPPPAPPAAPTPAPSKPAPAPAPQQQPPSAPTTHTKPTQPTVPHPTPAAPPTTTTPAHPTTTQPQPAPHPPPRATQPPPAPQFKVPEIPQPPPNLTLADRLKFIEEHKEKQQKAIQAFHKQQAAAAAAAAAPQDAAKAAQPAQPVTAPQQRATPPAAAQQQQQPKAAAAAALQHKGAAAAPAAQPQQQPQQPQQQALPQREEQRPSRAAAQAQRAQRQQQAQQAQQAQQQQGGNAQPQQQGADAGAHARPTANGHASTSAPAAPKDKDVQGVYVRGLPQGEELTEALLEEHFSKFGPLKSPPGVPAVVIHVSPKFGKTAYIKFEQASSVQAARQSPPTIGSNTCEVLPMLTQYMNGPQPGMKGVSASRGSFRGAPRRGGRGGGGGGRGSGSGPEDKERTADQGSSAPHRDFGTERPPRPAGAPDRRPPTTGGRGGGGRGNRSRSGSASRPKRDPQGGGPQGQPGPTPTYVPVATSQ